MKKLVIDIFDKFIDFSSGFNETNKHRYGNTFMIDDLEVDIENRIYELIMRDKGDGVNTIIQQLENVTFMKIYLISSDPTSQYDIHYLIEYLESKFKIFQGEVICNQLEEYENLIKIRVGESSDINDIQDILKRFKLWGIDYKVLAREDNIYEHGAGNAYTELIVAVSGGIISGAMLLGVQAIINKIKNERRQKNLIEGYIIFGDFNKNKLLLNFAREINDPNIKKYRISKFSEIENNMYSVVIEKRDIRYDVICNKEAEILNTKVTYII